MSKIKFYFILLIATITVISCNKDDNNVEVTPPIPYAEQYPKDIAAIEDYLKTNYISKIVNHPGFPDDQDVTIEKITNAATQPSLWSYLNSPTLPRLTSRNVDTSKELGSPLGGVTYKIYTLLIREGVKNSTVNSGGEYPCNVDGVYAGYKGTLLNGTVFDSSNNGQVLYNLDGSKFDGGTGVIRGWSEGFPQFMTGWVSSNPDGTGTIQYNDFGVGVMFLPSGLGYYNTVQGDIPAYSPLVFSVKLYALKRYDHEINSPPSGSYRDPDGIFSFQEDLDGDRYIYTFASGVYNPDDTDGDGIPNYYDSDDDGDGYATKGEIKDAKGINYPFESIPDCSGDQTNPNRLKRHLDKNCIKMNQ
ncbi:FKBP-type peptidyl-prolyl cis-trans isomerase [Flavobacterium sp. M31R6]|uniref:FKBP-type peptidyl-prolyl cis-trans isomerase n=1 Tax=Flavobacterium sp. M31R6 TaxID=2739062 RepID=UPI00156A300F|nr:FKBP-type peptidylprolyl isomerase [Flavobacterium sp. M31R6]QKJ64568.1 FKBP-type peptidylprolyl isomerase [Flavobacterium sp. M31R6]